MQHPIVSIIIPVYNGGAYIRPCIDSILHQTCEDWELLLIDDGSTDDSGKICDEYTTDPRIRVIHKSNTKAMQDQQRRGMTASNWHEGSSSALSIVTTG